jgi:hypothetical protein
MLAPFSFPAEEVEAMMRRESIAVTREFGKIKDLSERLSRSIFSAILAAFEAYGTALCGHVPIACPLEQISCRAETKQGTTSAVREPRTKMFAAVHRRPNHKLPVVSQCQL